MVAIVALTVMATVAEQLKLTVQVSAVVMQRMMTVAFVMATVLHVHAMI